MYTVEYKGYTVIFRDETRVRDLSKERCSIALGNFDGVHIAHKELILKALEMRNGGISALAGAWSFRENPLKYFVKNPPKSIYTPEKKAETLLSLGLDFVVLADFGHFMDMPHGDFCKYLKDDIGAAAVVCGYNYRFGKGGEGNPNALNREFGADNCFVVGEIDHAGSPVSSTRIRGLIEGGDISLANTLLGRAFSLDSEVVSGKQLGRSLGVPTANQFFSDGLLIPKSGIYATRCTIDGKTYIGVTNIGVRPTVEDSKTVNAETYILNFSGDIYGKIIKIEFIEYLRGEMKFPSLEELRDAILSDAERARGIVKL